MEDQIHQPSADERVKAHMEKVNRFTRRALSPEEAFLFPVVLCDNEVDRDLERFPVASLEVLKGLFVGKTGLFDHAAKAEHQSARIFDTEVIREERANSLGEPYCFLKGWAYMVRTDANQNLIREIDGGIKKEVSVGCSVDKVLCSICGRNQKEKVCGHVKGKAYGGETCHHQLVDPTDAYEWSFVAVPAQKNAGVTKRLGSAEKQMGGGTLEKLFAASGDVVVTGEERRKLALEYHTMRQMAHAGREHWNALRREVVKLAVLAQPELDAAVLGQAVENLEIETLKSLRDSFGRAAAKRYPLRLQLGRRDHREQTAPDNRYKFGYDENGGQA